MFEMSPGTDSAVLPCPSNSNVLSLLLVEDSVVDAQLVRHYLRVGLDQDVNLKHVETVTAAHNTLISRRYDLVLLDLNLPDSTGLDTFSGVRSRAKNSPVLILSGDDNSQLAVAAVRAGAQDYLFKGELGPQSLGRQVRLAIERNNRISLQAQLKVAHEQIRVARHIQKGLYPQTAPSVEGFDIAGHAWAAEHACGDLFDFLPDRDGTIGVVVGDVSGHGLGAALKMIETRAALHAFAEYETDLAKLIGGVHRVFCSGQDFETPCMFITMFLGRLNPENHILSYASAGHSAFHISEGGHIEETVTMDYPIGVADEMSGSETCQVTIEPGDVFVIPTDGFYEAGMRQNNGLGREGMLSTVRANQHRTSSQIIDAMYAASCEQLGGAPLPDDMAAIVIKAT